MLVLNRFQKQAFYLFLEDGTRVKVKVLQILKSRFGNLARIGIEAPPHVNIAREELVDLEDEETYPMECQQ